MSTQTAALADTLVNFREVLGLGKAVYKYKGELGAWKIDYFLGKGKTEENVTHLEWTAVAATPDYATAGKPPLIDGDTILLNLGTSAVIIVKDASLDGIKKRLKKVFNLTLTSAEETTQL